jgi:hypothetical protein
MERSQALGPAEATVERSDANAAPTGPDRCCGSPEATESGGETSYWKDLEVRIL